MEGVLGGQGIKKKEAAFSWIIRAKRGRQRNGSNVWTFVFAGDVFDIEF